MNGKHTENNSPRNVWGFITAAVSYREKKLHVYYGISP